MNILNVSSLPLQEKDSLPHVRAIYFVFSQYRKLLYVGKAEDLRSRWKNHHRFSQFNYSGTRIAWIEFDSETDLMFVESLFISAFLPSLNNSSVTHPEPSNSEFAPDAIATAVSVLQSIMSLKISDCQNADICARILKCDDLDPIAIMNTLLYWRETKMGR